MVPIAWRNLWRNPRRTWLSSLAIAFAVLLLGFFMSLQMGQYAAMVDGATSMLHGHYQVQRAGYADDPRLESTVPDAQATAERIAALPGVAAVGRRLMVHALISSGETSFAALIQGVESDVEPRLVRLPMMVRSGRYLSPDGANDQAVIGESLAKNLHVGVGDELTIIGTAAEGGVAAAAVHVVGIFDAANDELNRSLVQIPLGAFAEAFNLHDEAHTLIVRAHDPSDSTLEALSGAIDRDLRVLDWRALMPELEQMIDLDRITGVFFYVLIAVMVTFSIVNTFVMTVFERTREFGMLMALGMRTRSLVGLLQLEALCLVTMGVAIGAVAVLVVVGWVARVGFPLPSDATEMLQSLHMPERIFPVLNTVSFVTAPAVMFVAVQLAALFPSLRVRRLVPVTALRAT